MVDITIKFFCEKCGHEEGDLEIIGGDYLVVRCDNCQEWEQL